MSNTLCCAMRVEPFGSTSNGERVPSFFSTHHLHIIPNLNLSVMKKISEGGTRAMGNHQRGGVVDRLLVLAVGSAVFGSAVVGSEQAGE